MLVKMEDATGSYLLRKKFDRGSFTASQRQMDLIGTWRGQMSFADLLVERGGPFAGSFEEIDRFQRDGRSWVRFSHPTLEYCFDVEVMPDGEMGDIVPVPPEEAWTIALARDEKRPLRVLLED